MPGVFQLSVDEAVKEAAAAKAEGVPGVLLFGLPDDKDVVGSAAYDPEAPVQSAIRAIKQEVPGCSSSPMCASANTPSHGHCGIVVDEEIANDVTVEQLVRAALSHAAAGADIVAPSDMMDGRVGAHPRGARRARVHADGDHGVRGEVLLGLLRSVPRGRRFGACVRRSAIAPDGSGQRRRSRSARSRSTSKKGPTSSWSSRRSRIST